jgi:hypothetical protein
MEAATKVKPPVNPSERAGERLWRREGLVNGCESPARGDADLDRVRTEERDRIGALFAAVDQKTKRTAPIQVVSFEC